MQAAVVHHRAYLQHLLEYLADAFGDFASTLDSAHSYVIAGTGSALGNGFRSL